MLVEGARVASIAPDGGGYAITIAHEGDREATGGALLRAAFAAYVTPLLLLLLAAGIGQQLGGELGAALGGLCGLLLAGLQLKRRRTPVSYPVVLRRGESVGACR